jgi:N-acyl-D-amino-acid deacylase
VVLEDRVRKQTRDLAGRKVACDRVLDERLQAHHPKVPAARRTRFDHPVAVEEQEVAGLEMLLPRQTSHERASLGRMDLVIRNATVYDGTGARGQRADVGITGDVIDAVGDLAAEHAASTVDAKGLAVAPGFIDVHSHDDFAVFLMPDMDFKVCQGVTTDIVGNCGLGAAPFDSAQGYLQFFGADGHRDALPSWRSYPEYLDAIDRDPPSCNVAVLAGHGTIRLDAMGIERRAPSDAELAVMIDTIDAAIDAGCVGLSTGLIYEPGRYAHTDELIALANTMAGTGALYASHMRNEGTDLVESVTETIRIGEVGGVPVQISHHKATGRAAWGLVNESLALIDVARARGVDVTADQYPYTAGSTTLFAVVQNHDEGTAGTGETEWDKITLASAPNHTEWERRSIATLAVEFGTEPAEAARRIVDVEGYGAVVIMESIDEDDVRTVMAHPTTMIGSDGIPTFGGKPHPRLYGTFARVLGHYTRDAQLLSLEEAIHRMTGMPARKFGLAGRGTVAPGAAADLVLFDPAQIDDVATYDDPRKHPAGIVSVWVNGTAVVRDGAHTGARPGRAVRRA